MSAISARKARLAAATQDTTDRNAGRGHGSASELDANQNGLIEARKDDFPTGRDEEAFSRTKRQKTRLAEGRADLDLTNQLSSDFDKPFNANHDAQPVEKVGSTKGQWQQQGNAPSTVAAAAAMALAYCTHELSLAKLVKGKGKADEGDVIVCGMQCDERIALIGSYSVKVLDGSIYIAGAELTRHHEKAHVFAPRSGGIPVICASSEPVEALADGAWSLPEEKYAAIVQIEDINDSGIEDIAQACHLIRSDAFHFAKSPSGLWNLQHARPVLGPTKNIFSVQPLSFWESILQRVSKQTHSKTFMVRGPKRSGKSTFCRMLLQRLQSSSQDAICYLETDLGQPEFGPPGTVALHVLDSCHTSSSSSSPLVIGPSWACIRQPVLAHFVGDTSPRNNPRLYMAGIADLLKNYKETYGSAGTALVINTQGWIKGMGADLLAQIEQLAKPDHIFEMQGEQDFDVDTMLGLSNSSRDLERIVPVDAAPVSLTRERGLNPVDARTLALVSYFYMTASPCPYTIEVRSKYNSPYPRWDFSSSLVSQPPFIVDVGSGLRGGIHFLPGAAAIEQRLQLQGLNASCVAITMMYSQDGRSKEHNRRPSISPWLSALNQEIPSPQKSACLGLGIVRSIDVEVGTIHLLTPVTADTVRLARASLGYSEDPSEPKEQSPIIALVKGSLELPVWLSLDDKLLQDHAPQNAMLGALSGKDMWPSAARKADATAQSTLAGVPLSAVPYLDFDSGDGSADDDANSSHATGANSQSLGLDKRRIRRNLLRHSQHRSRDSS